MLHGLDVDLILVCRVAFGVSIHCFRYVIGVIGYYVSCVFVGTDFVGYGNDPAVPYYMMFRVIGFWCYAGFFWTMISDLVRVLLIDVMLVRVRRAFADLVLMLLGGERSWSKCIGLRLDLVRSAIFHLNAVVSSYVAFRFDNVMGIY